jgi:hypothetical protein
MALSEKAHRAQGFGALTQQLWMMKLEQRWHGEGILNLSHVTIWNKGEFLPPLQTCPTHPENRVVYWQK